MQIFLKTNADVRRTDIKLQELYRNGEIENPEPTTKNQVIIRFKKGSFKGLKTLFTAPGNLIVSYTTKREYEALIKKLKDTLVSREGEELTLVDEKRIPVTYKHNLEKASEAMYQVLLGDKVDKVLEEGREYLTRTDFREIDERIRREKNRPKLGPLYGKRDKAWLRFLEKHYPDIKGPVHEIEDSKLVKKIKKEFDQYYKKEYWENVDAEKKA